MTVEELYIVLGNAIKENPDKKNCVVGIPDNEPTIGATSITNIKACTFGFDWDINTFFMFPEHELKRVK